MPLTHSMWVERMDPLTSLIWGQRVYLDHQMPSDSHAAVQHERTGYEKEPRAGSADCKEKQWRVKNFFPLRGRESRRGSKARQVLSTSASSACHGMQICVRTKVSQTSRAPILCPLAPLLSALPSRGSTGVRERAIGLPVWSPSRALAVSS